MLESMEGRRGMPRLRPPFPAQSGYLGRPTLINNVETLAHVARIARGEWTPSRLWSVSGTVREPGCYEAPLDVTARQLIDDHAGGATQDIGALVPGGAASGILPPAALDVPLTRDALAEWGASPGSAGLQVFPATYSPLKLLAETMRFFAEESCQKCTPCRIGTRGIHHVLEELAARRGRDAARAGRGVARRDGLDLDLRPRPGGAGPGSQRLPPLARSCSSTWRRLYRERRGRLHARRQARQRSRGRAARPRRRAARRLHPDALPRRQARAVRRLPDVRGRRRGRAEADARLRRPASPRGWSSPRTRTSRSSARR